MLSRWDRFILLIPAALICIVLYWFGLMSFAWSDPIQRNPIAVFLIWFLPLLSLPALISYWAWQRVSPLLFWGFAACEWAACSWLSWDSYFLGRSTTANPILLTLSGGMALPVWCWIILAGLCQLEHYLRRRAQANSDQ